MRFFGLGVRPFFGEGGEGVEGDGRVVRGVGGGGVVGQQLVAEVEAAGVVGEGLVGGAGLGSGGEEVAELFEGDRHVPRGLGGGGVLDQQLLEHVVTASVVG